MQTSHQRMQSTTKALVASLCLCLTGNSYTDDTEIFIGDRSNATGVQPNVLFILDNSGSMSGATYDENGVRSPYSRMENMKIAFEEVMQGVSGVNVGLMSFNGDGGYIMYPVIDADTELSSENELESAIGLLTGSDDAIELKTSGNVYLDDETFAIAHTANRELGRNITAFLQHEDDDGEEFSSGNMTVNHSQFNMGYNQKNGLRYQDLGIPQGAKIVSAHLEFTASLSNDNHIDLRISGQNTSNPPQFNTSQLNISHRLAQQTSALVDWSLDGHSNWTSGNTYQSPDIAPIIQEIVNRDDWQNNDALVLLIEQTGGNGHRAGTLRREDRASTQGLDGDGTRLHITYNTSAAPMSDQMIGLRFSNIAIPAGATITAARIDFVAAAQNTQTDHLKIQVQVENSGDAKTFTSAKNALSNRTKFPDTVTWQPDDEWQLGQRVAGPDVTQLVQRVVQDNTDWCGNNAMAFFLQPATSLDTLSRLAYAFEGGVGKKPSLTISYTGGDNGCIRRVWQERINNEENDADQNGSNSTADNNNNYLKFDSNNYVGLRFEDIPVQQGSQVSNAYLEVISYRDDSGSTTLSLAAHDIANAPAFPQSRRNISNRSLTTQSTDWVVDDWRQDTTYRSPDISHIINEILAKNDWQAGNAMAFVLENSNYDTRYIHSYRGSSGKAARLVLTAASGAIESTVNTARHHQIDLVHTLNPRGLTPATGALYEAALYFTGGAVDYGQSRNNSRYGRVSHTGSWTDGAISRSTNCQDDDLDHSNCASEHLTGTPKYRSPITSACQTSHVVLLTDGAANNNEATTKIGNLIDDHTCSSDSGYSGERCARSLAKWMANEDLMPSLNGSINSVNTHTVAFNLSEPYAVDFLQSLAQEGNGGFYNVNTSSDLSSAFDSILQSVRSTAASFVAPGATVNQFNRLSHRAEVYFSVFKPEATPRWAGNLKRYKLLGNPAVISDVNDKAAVDSTTGFFKDGAQSVWSSQPDSAVVAAGGAANQRPQDPDDLNIYTWLAGTNNSSTDLTADVNQVHESNNEISQTMLNVADADRRNALLQWIRGLDVLDWDGDNDTDEVRQQYADPLHSIPHIITYGGDDENPETAIFFGTNGGYLHAIDGASGAEIFSFMPESQLPLMHIRHDNTARFTHPYGVDGSPTSWIHDANGDNKINKSDGDFAYLYFGLRRGGRELFAIDVTQRDKPSIMWHIQGGHGDFTELGQTWSTPVISKIRDGDTIRDVLIFGGGYNTAFDDATFASPTSTGNALYIVDAKTGERLWYASSAAISGQGQRISDLQYPIPADIAVIDVNGDGLVEQLYAADLFGQVFRFDVNALSSGANWLSGGVIASLSQPDAPDNRRFFNAPDISLTHIAKKPKIAISIGSGSRPTPLSRLVQNRFYMLLQDAIFVAPASHDVITHVDLVDQSNQVSALDQSKSGWYFDLPHSGEKVLSASMTLANKVIFTTYAPDRQASSCNPVIGTGRAYVLHLIDSSAVADLDEDDALEDTQDRSKTLASGNIPPSPKVLLPDDGAPTVLIGPEQPLGDIDLGLTDDWTQIYRRPATPNFD